MADVGKGFESLPIGQLICTPILAVAQGQAELCRVYLDHLFKLAFVNGKPEDGVNKITFNLNRVIIDESGDAKEQTVKVEVPIIALVPVPAFTMDEATVRFTMEIKEIETNKNINTSESTCGSKFSYWGYSANISGKVTASAENTRTSDQSAKYEIYARAAQQPAAEGMAKLSNIFASVIEPIEV